MNHYGNVIMWPTNPIHNRAAVGQLGAVIQAGQPIVPGPALTVVPPATVVEFNDLQRANIVNLLAFYGIVLPGQPNRNVLLRCLQEKIGLPTTVH